MTRVWLVLICLALLALALLGMRLGWRNRARRQAELPGLPDVPRELGAALLGPLAGVYVGSTFAASWQDRVVHAGLGIRANAVASVHRAGVLIERDGAGSVFVPTSAITGARLAPGLAGKVVGEGGLLVISWRSGDVDAGMDIDSGLRADDKRAYPAWVRALTPSGDESARSGTENSPSLDYGIRHSTGKGAAG